MGLLILSLGKENWECVDALINSKNFDNIYIVTDKYGKDNYNIPELSNINITLLVLDFHNDITALIEELRSGLVDIFKESKILDLDIAINISSGMGKEHNVLLSAVMKTGYGIRLVDIDKNGKVVEL